MIWVAMLRSQCRPPDQRDVANSTRHEKFRLDHFIERNISLRVIRRVGYWPFKKTLPREVGEKPGSAWSQATIAAISGLVPTMFMTSVRL